MSRGTHPDVVIAGGGIMGCLTAYFLGLHGLTSTVVERDAIASQASGAAAGLLSPLAESPLPGPLTDLCILSLRLHTELREALQAESGVDYDFAWTPILRLAFTEEEETKLQAQFQWQKEKRLKVNWLDGTTLSRMSGWLPRGARCALYSEGEAQVETYQLTLAAALAAEKRGATIRPGTVTGIARRGHAAQGLRLADGTLVEAQQVVLALGPWSCFASPWLGIPVPVEPLRGQIIKLSSPAAMPEYAIYHGGCYVLPKPAGHILAGTTEERAGFVRQVTPEGQRHIMDTALRMAPILEKAQALEATSCLRPLSQDGLPIIGRVPGWDNVYLATGHGRKGILLSAATAKLLAQLIATGQAERDLSPYSPQRFAP